MHLNPVRVGLLGLKDRLIAYPWRSLGWYLAAPAHRPAWMRVDRLLGEHGVQKDDAAGRAQFERRMECRRAEANHGAEWKPLERGWYLGGQDFRAKLLEQMEAQLGEHHSGRLKFEAVAAKSERIIAEELKRLKRREQELEELPKGHVAKLAIAERLRKETTLTIPQITLRLHMGSWKSLRNKFYLRRKADTKRYGDVSTV